MAKSWALTSWQTGQVGLLEAFGITSGGPFAFPQLTASLPSQASAATAPPTGSTPGSGGSSGTSATPSGGSVQTNLSQYTQAQLQQLWIQAGGNPAKAKIASAIAWAESKGQANATDHDANGTTDEGLWQINTVHGSQATYDPLGNARSAVAISANGTNWTPWVTFNSGAYLAYM